MPQYDDPSVSTIEDEPMAVYCRNNCDDLLIKEPNTGVCEHLGNLSGIQIVNPTK